MLVSELITFRDRITKRFEFLEQDTSLDNLYNNISLILTENADIEESIAHNKIRDILNDYDILCKKSVEIKNKLPAIINDVNDSIDQLAEKLLVKQDDQPFKHYHKTEFNISNEIDLLIRSNIHQHADWHFPAMQIGCRSLAQKYTAELIANDPLYICDIDPTYINKATAQFNDLYNKRIRKYVISNHNMDVLPRNQFGFILGWMFFNFAGGETLENYLINLIKLLRPGGTLMFSYNNGDIFDSCRLVETGGMSYIPKRKILDMCDRLGYIIVNSYDLPNTDDQVKYVSWIEIQKPGVLSTIKRAQAIGRVVSK
jgi:SAM-dependent methyltransferase